MQTQDFKLSIVGANLASDVESFLNNNVKSLEQVFNDQLQEWEYSTDGLYEWWLAACSSFIMPNQVNYNIFVAKNVPFDWNHKLGSLYENAIENEHLDDTLDLHPFEFDSLVYLTDKVVQSYWDAYQNGIVMTSGNQYIKDVSVIHGDILLTIGERVSNVSTSSMPHVAQFGINSKYQLA